MRVSGIHTLHIASLSTSDFNFAASVDSWRGSEASVWIAMSKQEHVKHIPRDESDVLHIGILSLHLITIFISKI